MDKKENFKEKEEKKKENNSVIVDFINTLPYFLIGVFILLSLAGAEHICPEFFKEDEENDLSRLMFAHSLVEYGRSAAVLLIIVLPALMNIALYLICGFWISVLFQVILYYAVTNRVY